MGDAKLFLTLRRLHSSASDTIDESAEMTQRVFDLIEVDFGTSLTLVPSGMVAQDLCTSNCIRVDTSHVDDINGRSGYTGHPTNHKLQMSSTTIRAARGGLSRSNDIITLFSVNIECTEAQAKVLTDKLDSLDEDFDNPGWAGHLQLYYQGGELVIESYESGQPRELGEMIARWQTDTGHDKPVSYLFTGQQACEVIDCGRVDAVNGKLSWNYIDLGEIVTQSTR